MEGPRLQRPYFDMAKLAQFNRGSLVVLGAVAGLVAGMLVGPALAQSPEPGGTTTSDHTISVTGTGTVKITPDLADVQLGINITRDTVKAARDAAAEAMNAVMAALKTRLDALKKDRPGLDLQVGGNEAHILIPERYRVTHEEHFAQVAKSVLNYLPNPKSLPPWEKANMLVKYFVTTKTVELSRKP